MGVRATLPTVLGDQGRHGPCRWAQGGGGHRRTHRHRLVCSEERHDPPLGDGVDELLVGLVVLDRADGQEHLEDLLVVVLHNHRDEEDNPAEEDEEPQRQLLAQECVRA